MISHLYIQGSTNFQESMDPRSHNLNKLARVHILTPINEIIPVDLPGGGLEAKQQEIIQPENEIVLMKKEV